MRVRDIMADDCTKVDGTTDLQTLAEDVLMRTGRRCVVVESGGETT